MWISKNSIFGELRLFNLASIRFCKIVRSFPDEKKFLRELHAAGVQQKPLKITSRLLVQKFPRTEWLDIIEKVNISCKSVNYITKRHVYMRLTWILLDIHLGSSSKLIEEKPNENTVPSLHREQGVLNTCFSFE